MNRPHILVIEDERDMRELLRRNLVREGYDVTAVETGEEGLEIVKSHPVQLILLDIMLPGISGLDLCRIIKEEPRLKEIPILMLTARGEERDQVEGLDSGAEDYVTKPFSLKVLFSRVRALLRRSPSARLVFGRMTIDSETRRVTIDDEAVDLTGSEFDLLYTLASKPGRAFSRYGLVDIIRGEDAFIGERSVDVHIAHLRGKLGPLRGCIQTVRGAGYRFEAPS